MNEEELSEEWDKPVRWIFESVNPVREDSISEVVFTKKWQKLMGGTVVEADRYFIYNEPQNYPILDIHSRFFGLEIPDARDTQIYSSFISWIGTRNGQSYLDNAERLKPAFERAARESIGFFNDYSHAYVAAWGIENERSSITKDYTPAEQVNQGLLRVFNSAINLHDIQVLNCAAHWLGRPDGQDYLKSCQDNISLKRERERQTRLSLIRTPK